MSLPYLLLIFIVAALVVVLIINLPGGAGDVVAAIVALLVVIVVIANWNGIKRWFHVHGLADDSGSCLIAQQGPTGQSIVINAQCDQPFQNVNGSCQEVHSGSSVVVKTASGRRVSLQGGDWICRR
jgi:hypothetical protein